MSSALTLTPLSLRKGVLEGRVENAGSGVPQVEVLFLDKPVDDASLTETDNPKVWSLSVPIPADAIAEGVQTFLIVDRGSDQKIGHFTLMAGEVLGDDLRAEVELLRAELDMLKRAFRRHCLEVA